MDMVDNMQMISIVDKPIIVVITGKPEIWSFLVSGVHGRYVLEFMYTLDLKGMHLCHDIIITYA